MGKMVPKKPSTKSTRVGGIQTPFSQKIMSGKK